MGDARRVPAGGWRFAPTRIRRGLSRLLLAVSLLLLVAFVGSLIWTVSYLGPKDSANQMQVTQLTQGAFVRLRATALRGDSASARFGRPGLRVFRNRGNVRWLAVRYPTYHIEPLWPPALVLGLASYLLILPDLRAARRRRRAGLCPNCDYDLRGTPAGNPCPECGTAR